MVFLNIFHLLLAILGLGFLIFIHELGHYVVARKTGMKVEIFSIGFGPVIRKWDVSGVTWQLCILPFGGYVRIAGMEKKEGLEPYQIENGYYSKSPFQRIKVALAGPLTNVAFAFVAFTLIWMTGGQSKPFQDITNIVGYVDTESAFNQVSTEPGDIILSVNHEPVRGYSDLMLKTALSDQETVIQGDHMNYQSLHRAPFSLTLPNTSTPQQRIDLLGILPAQYLIFDSVTSATSPLSKSGIEKGDRLVWADGSLLFSQRQLSSILNDSTTLLTIERSQRFFQIQVPRIKISDLRLSQEFKNELDDWKHAATLSAKLTDLYFIPYQITVSCVIEDGIPFLNATAEQVDPTDRMSLVSAEKLQAGDHIVAIDGQPVSSVYQMFQLLQQRNALLIVQKKGAPLSTPWNEADAIFEKSFDISLLSQMIQSIGTPQAITEKGSLKLLSPIPLKPLTELELDHKTRAQMTAFYEAQKKAIEKIENPQQRELELTRLEQNQKRLMLGALLTDAHVQYNPTPFEQFSSVFHQAWKTLASLFKGSLTPKSMSGPVGIVQVLQQSWASGMKDALFWLGFVSLNLAVLNLLPIPVLDGGHIVFSVIEWITKKPIPSKTMERWVIPFVVLLILLFIYLTYQDIARLIHRLF